MENDFEHRQGRSKKQEDDSVRIIGMSMVILIVVLGILLMVGNF